MTSDTNTTPDDDTETDAESPTAPLDTETTVLACPRCDSSDTRPRTSTPDNAGAGREVDPEAAYYCGACQRGFDDPVRRPPQNQSFYIAISNGAKPNDQWPTPDDYYDALCAAYDDGQVDAADGGVPAPVVADRVDDRGVDTSTARQYLYRFVTEGRAELRRGLCPETLQQRRSFVPLGDGDTDGSSDDSDDTSGDTDDSSDTTI